MPTYSNNYSRGQFGVQGGYRGTGQDIGEWTRKATERLLSPEEFGRLDANVRGVYGGYMGYLNAFTRQQKIKKAIPAAYLSAQAGTYEPPQGGVSYGKAVSTRGTPNRVTKSGERIPKTTIHRSLGGIPTEELGGGGVRRGIGGEVIPQTAEQVGDITDIARSAAMAIPRAREKTADELLDVELAPAMRGIKKSETLMKLADTSFKGDMTAAQRYKESTRGQAQQRIDDRATENTAKQNRWMGTLNHKEYMANVKSELRRGNMSFAHELRGLTIKDRQEWRTNMAVLKGEIPGTEQSILRHKEMADRTIKIANNAFENAKTKMDMDFARKQVSALNDYREWLDKQIINPDTFRQNKDLLSARIRQYGSPQYKQPSQASAKEVKRSIKGRTTIFNADTKAFIRWE